MVEWREWREKGGRMMCMERKKVGRIGRMEIKGGRMERMEKKGGRRENGENGDKRW